MRRNRTIIYLASFLFAIPVALTAYINSSFLESHLSPSVVGMLYVVSSILTILLMEMLPRLLSKIGNKRLARGLSILILLSFLVMALADGRIVIAGAFIVNFVAITLLYESIDIFVEDFSRGKSIGTFRGFYLAIINLAWILAQLLSVKISIENSFTGIYLTGSMLMLLVYLIFRTSFYSFADPKYERTSFIKGVKLFIQNKNLGIVYVLNLILKFFYAWMVIYTPIYLHDSLGFSWSELGLIFTIMLVPFLLEFPLGKLSDKIGEKKIMRLGFLTAALSTLVIPFITEHSLLLWAGVLFMTRVGAAMVEVMSENYFFKSVKEENVEALGFFRNTSPVSYVLGPIAGVFILSFVPSFVYLYYILGALLLVGTILVSKLKEVR